MKNIVLLLMLLSVMGCGDKETITKEEVEVEVVETKVQDMPAQVYEGSILENKEAFIKANDFYGYKGDIRITVNRYDENYGSWGSSSNIGVVYNAYIDTASRENQKIIFYKSEHASELEVSTENGKTTVFYEKNKVYDSPMSRDEALKNFPINKYPETITENISLGDDFTTSFIRLVSLELPVQRYITDAEMDGYDPNDDYSFKVETDEELRILGDYFGDNGNSYSWENGVVKERFFGTMAEGITIEFLDEKGWIRRSDNR